jgi:putative FmdB family regulatory protein
MPTYDYKCEHCGRFQVTQRITEDPLKECPTCGQAVDKPGEYFQCLALVW